MPINFDKLAAQIRNGETITISVDGYASVKSLNISIRQAMKIRGVQVSVFPHDDGVTVNPKMQKPRTEKPNRMKTITFGCHYCGAELKCEVRIKYLGPVSSGVLCQQCGTTCTP